MSFQVIWKQLDVINDKLKIVSRFSKKIENTSITSRPLIWPFHAYTQKSEQLLKHGFVLINCWLSSTIFSLALYFFFSSFFQYFCAKGSKRNNFLHIGENVLFVFEQSLLKTYVLRNLISFNEFPLHNPLFYNPLFHLCDMHW